MLYKFQYNFICSSNTSYHTPLIALYSTVTDFARFRGLSTSSPLATLT